MPRSSTVIAFVALFVALGGSAFAAAKLTGKDVRDGTLTGADVRNGSLSGADLRRGSIPADRLKGLPTAQRAATPGPQGPAGPQGAAGATGPQGPAGPPASEQASVTTFSPGAMLWEPTAGSGATVDPNPASYTQHANTGFSQANGIVPAIDLGPTGRRRIAAVEICVSLAATERIESLSLGTQGPIDAIGDRPEESFVDEADRRGPLSGCTTVTPPPSFVLDQGEALFVSMRVRHITARSFTITQTSVRTVPA
jgi:hypothetical protein